jgi:hypothetical protein
VPPGRWRAAGSAYGPRPGPIAAPDEILTIDPDPRGIMSPLSTSWQRMNGAWKFTAQDRIQRLSGYSLTGM